MSFLHRQIEIAPAVLQQPMSFEFQMANLILPRRTEFPSLARDHLCFGSQTTGKTAACGSGSTPNCGDGDYVKWNHCRMRAEGIKTNECGDLWRQRNSLPE